MSNDAKRRLSVVVGLCELYGREMTDAAIEMFLGALADVPADALERAAGRCVQECKFFPTVAEIRERAGFGVKPVADRALVAWAEAWAAADEHGSYASVVFADAVTARAIEAMGGWPAFCRPDGELTWHRKLFVDFYRAFAGDTEPSAPVRLKGIHEATDGRERPAALIGTPDPKALPAPREKSDAECMGEVVKRLEGANLRTRGRG